MRNVSVLKVINNTLWIDITNRNQILEYSFTAQYVLISYRMKFKMQLFNVCGQNFIKCLFDFGSLQYLNVGAAGT